MTGPTDVPADALAAYARATTTVDAFLSRRGVAHVDLRDSIIDHTVRAMLRHGLAEGAKLVEGIAVEQARHRANRVDAEVDAYRASGGSRGLVTKRGV